MSNEMNVKECIEGKKQKKSNLAYPTMNSTNAFHRLVAVRQLKKELISKVNDNVEGMPQETRDMYDDLICLMKKIEIEEGMAVALGE